ncbi:MAG: hypothetical protein R3F35_04980 [Myxococcota bacterium]
MAGLRWVDALDSAMSETFEGMAFAEVARGVAATASAEPDAQVWACVDVVEPPFGPLVVVVGRAFAARLEETITGAEHGDEGGRLDALGELANALAGRLARRIDPRGERIVLGLPKVGVGAWSGEDALDWVVYVADDRDPIRIGRRR